MSTKFTERQVLNLLAQSVELLRKINIPPIISVVTKPDSKRSYPWTGAFITVICFLIYSAVFFPLHSRTGLVAAIFSFLPVMVAGLWLGFWNGLLASLLAFFINTLLYNIIGFSGWDAVITHGGGPGSIAILIIGGVTGLMSDLNRRLSQEIADRKLKENALDQRAHELQTLFQTTLEINTQTDLDSLLTSIVERATSLVGADSGGLYLIQEDSQCLKLVANFNSPEQDIGYKVSLGEGVAGTVAQNGEVIVVEDYQDWDVRLKVYDNTPLHRVIGVPLKVKNKTIGVITIADRTKAGLFLEEEIRLVGLFAEQAALAIENTRLLEYERNRISQLATLYEAARAISSNLELESVLQTVVVLMSTVSGSDGCSISILNREQNTVTTLLDYSTKYPELTDIKGTKYSLVDFPATRQVIETGKPLFINPTMQNADQAELVYMRKNEITNLLMLPIVRHGQVTGLVELYNEENEARVYSQEEIQFLQSLSAIAAIAIENARLYTETQRHLRQATALREIDQAIAGKSNLLLMVEVVLKHAISELGVDAAVILLYDPSEQKLRYELGSGFRTNALQSMSLRLGEGYAGQAALTKQTLHISNLQKRTTDFLRSPVFYREGFVSYFGVPLIAKGEIKGVLEIFHRSSLEPEKEWLDFMEILSNQIAIAIDSTTLYKDLQHSNKELYTAYEATIEGWSRALDLRDKETEGHAQRVTKMTLRLAKMIGIGEKELVHIRRGSLLHDIGKMGIPDHILQKPGRLTEEERDIVQRHPVYAYNMLKPIEYLKPALDIPYCHHEKWDGTGYPRGLKGEEIPLAARIFAVIDVYDALTSNRPYRQAWDKKKALRYIQELSGKYFDPKIVRLAMQIL